MQPRRQWAVVVVVALMVLALAGGLARVVLRREPGPPPTAAPTPSQSAVASAAVDLPVTGITATSVRPPDGGVRYDPQMVLDEDPGTAWVAGSGRLVGETLTITLHSPARVTELLVANGYQKSSARFVGNGRASQLRVRFDDGTETVVSLQDVEGLQTVLVTGPGDQPPPTTTVVLTATEGVPGSPSNLALSTVRLRGFPA